MTELNWAIIGPGEIAHQFADAMQKMGRTIYAVGARKKEKGEAFAAEYGIQTVYDDFDVLFADENIDVVYIATPNSHHFEFMMQAVQAGKHILVEKAITINTAELAAVQTVAAEKNLIVAEAMTIFHMPLYKKLREIANSGKLGELKMIQASFGSAKPNDPTNRFFNLDLGGGALLDIGTYALSFARFFMNETPTEILTTVKKYETGVDEQSGIILRNEKMEMAVVSLTFRSKMPKRGIVAYEKGFITIDEYPRSSQASITYSNGNQEIVTAGDSNRALSYEILDMEESIANGASQTMALTEDVIQIMTNVREQWGIKFPFEK
ncbi:MULTISPECIES: Gfo/Idh/MocA family protein [Listeria]|uniref:Gfo/Idh/MocA family protein n=1 Tax=Listeria TaxID=1637 RepID=UPI000B588B23|nr:MULTISPECIES: Gfo/Idh/MocA family oxidoreductase [Listeria]